ncbi:hypothetical protein ACFYZH_10000 [Streptomyces abikoensis]|uniref:hypothetical protein n=1 Tax=Streptomyces abikoensis TaxID=97398 RepID=UPI0036A57CCE
MARFIFGGTTDTAAETATGARLPNATGTVWSSPAEDATQLTDLVDMNGNPMSMLTADKNGMVPAFYGPDGYSYVWVDFGAGRYMMTASDTTKRLDDHISGSDPHGDRNYADGLFDRSLPKTGGSITSDSGRAWLTVRVPGGNGDSTGSTMRLTDGTATYTRLANSGQVYLDTVGPHTPLSIGAPITAAQAFITCRTGRASEEPEGAVFTVKGDGSVLSGGTITAQNVGMARVFSGPTPPQSPRIGDVWVKYGE